MTDELLKGWVARWRRRDLASALCSFGYRVPDFSVDVHEGVSCSCIQCTVALTTAECAEFADRVRTLPGVLSIEPSC